MIIFDKTEVYGFEGALRGMRNPLNSWDKSDSGYYGSSVGNKNYIIGQKDMELCKKLIMSGTEHRKFLRQIFVSVDITAPLYWWKEFDTYKVGTVANSCSTMHTIHKKIFEMSDFATDHLMVATTGLNEYDEEVPMEQNLWYETMRKTIDALNVARRFYLETKDKQYWYAMIQLLPSSYLQKRTVVMNYENLRSMCHHRKSHKLDEWRIDFVDWIKSLPYAEDLIIFNYDEPVVSGIDVKIDGNVMNQILTLAT